MITKEAAKTLKHTHANGAKLIMTLFLCYVCLSIKDWVTLTANVLITISGSFNNILDAKQRDRLVYHLEAYYWHQSLINVCGLCQSDDECSFPRQYFETSQHFETVLTSLKYQQFL